MKAGDKIKEKIFAEINALPEPEQQAILGIVENYIHTGADETSWSTIPETWRNRIYESLQQAEKKEFILNEDAVSYIQKKYGLNG
jgi:hypothetical protein